MFPSFLTSVLTQHFFPKPLTTFLTCIRGESRKIAGKKVCRKRLSNPQSPDQQSDTVSVGLTGQVE